MMLLSQYDIIDLVDCPDIMDVNVERVSDVTVVELIGSFDSNSAAAAQDTILPLVQNASKLLMDMSKVTYMSSAGLRTLLLLYRAISENGGNILLTGLSEELRDVMAITGFIDFFETANSRDHGLRTLRSA